LWLRIKTGIVVAGLDHQSRSVELEKAVSFSSSATSRELFSNTHTSLLVAIKLYRELYLHGWLKRHVDDDTLLVSLEKITPLHLVLNFSSKI
jgi:hypothetical protein